MYLGWSFLSVFKHSLERRDVLVEGLAGGGAEHSVTLGVMNDVRVKA